MIQLLLLLIVIALLVITVAKIRSLPREQKKWLFIQMGIGILCMSLLLILMTGRIHWLGIVIGAAIPILKTFLVKTSNTSTSSNSNTENTTEQSYSYSSAASNMTIQEALSILGLEGDITSGQITPDIVIDTHRKLIQKFHPDRGGNDYLAAKINLAKDVLLNALQS